MLTILRIFIVYKPLRFFVILGLIVAIPAIFFIARFLVLFMMGSGDGHIQSLVIAAGLLALAGISTIGGVLADLVATNRLLLEDLRTRVLRAEIKAEAFNDPADEH